MDPVDIHRESLLDTRTGEPREKISRILLVSRYSVDRQTLTEAIEKYCLEDFEQWTGAFLYCDGTNYSKVVFVTLEASALGLQQFLVGAVAGLLDDARVISITDDLSARAWPGLVTVHPPRQNN
jgi:hypothetical protein